MHPTTLGLGLALNSYAIYLNERLEGERGAKSRTSVGSSSRRHQSVQNRSRREVRQKNDLVARTLASAYLAKSNITKDREFGDRYGSLLAALDALRTALDRLERYDNQLRGIILFDLGHLNIHLYSMTGEISRARDAMYAYQEAETLLQSFPREFSQALLGTAMLVSEIPELRSLSQIEESISTADKALGFLENANDPQALARAQVCLGQLHAFRGAGGDFEIAVEIFQES